MQSKSTRGVQQEEVWAAADALVADGLRPTIERVRQKIGRGSPNTVSPMLEGWFATLGSRLKGDASLGSAQDLPVPVAKAAVELWKVAQAAANSEAVERLAERRQALKLERDALIDAQANLEERHKTLQLQETAMQETLALAKSQLTQSEGQVAALQATVQLRDSALAERQSALEQLMCDRETDRKEYTRQLNEQTEVLRRAEERTAANERRLLAEVDRSRQELKSAQGAQVESERRLDAFRQESSIKNQALGEKLHQTELEVASMRERLLSTEARAVELQRLLQEQTETTNAVIAQAARTAVIPAPRKNPASARRRSGVSKT